MSVASSGNAATLAECALITESLQRLACYDALAAQATQPDPAAMSVEEEVLPVAPPAEEELFAARISAEENLADNPWIVTPHKRNYLSASYLQQ